MSKILIIGNGFDLFHHLPTKYGHFMAVMKTIEELKIKEELTFEDLFDKNFKSEFDLELDIIRKEYDTKNIVFNNDKVKEMQDLLKENSWYKHFKNILEIETWIDFENEIENLLCDMSSIFNVLKVNPNNYNYYRKDKINVYNDLTCFGFIKEIRQLEVELKEDYLNIHNRTVKEKQILKKIAISIEQFISIFNKYLTEVIYLFYGKNFNNYSIPHNLINEIYTFNFTPTLERLYGVDNSKIVYLHGKSNQDNQIQNLVLGISEIPFEIKKHKMHDFTKYYQKINKSSNPKFIKISENKTNYLNETVFYIIGHSLDKSDKEYILDLFKFLDFDTKKNSKICVFYYNQIDKENKLNNLFSIIDGETIVNMNKENRLYFVELNQKNIDREFNKQLYKRDMTISIR